MRRTFLTALMMVGFFSILAFPVQAQRRPGSVDNIQIRQQQAAPQQVRQLDTDQNRDQLNTSRCDKIKANAQQHLEKFQTSRETRRNRYQHILTMLETVIVRASEAGLDTAEIKRVQIGLSEKVDQSTTDFGRVVDSAQALRQYQCDQTREELVPLVDDLKSAARQSEASKAEVVTYYQNLVKPALRALKAQATN